MAVIAVIQQKGGVVKSTITANLAGELVEKKLIVRVLDLDPQESLAAWARMTSARGRSRRAAGRTGVSGCPQDRNDAPGVPPIDVGEDFGWKVDARNGPTHAAR